MCKPGEEHWGALKRVLRCLTCFTVLCCSASIQKQVILTGFSNASWGNDINDRISTSGFVFFIGNCCVS